MMIEVDWTTFHNQYLNKNTLYVHEFDSFWDFYTQDGSFIIYCRVKKKENQEENFIFVERYLSGFSHIVKVKDIYPNDKKVSQNESMDEIDTIQEQLEEDLEDLKDELQH